MKLLAIQQGCGNTHMYECAPQNIQKFVPEIFKSRNYNNILLKWQNRLFILEKKLDEIDGSYTRTEITYHPLASKIETEPTQSFLR